MKLNFTFFLKKAAINTIPTKLDKKERYAGRGSGLYFADNNSSGGRS